MSVRAVLLKADAALRYSTTRLCRNSSANSAFDGSCSTKASLVSNSCPQAIQRQIRVVSFSRTLSDHSSKLTTVWQFGHLAEALSGMADIRRSPFLAIEL